MNTLARSSLTHTPADEATEGLESAFAEIAKALIKKVSAKLIKRIGASEPKSKEIRSLLELEMLPMLESEFFRRFLSDDNGDTFRRRNLLIHALAGANARLTTIHVVESDQASRAFDAGDDVLTSAQAAQLLHVSRTHVNSLVDSGKLGVTEQTEGGHRRISKSAVLAYKAKCKQRQARGLAAMEEASQRMGLYDDEMSGTPRRSSR